MKNMLGENLIYIQAMKNLLRDKGGEFSYQGLVDFFEPNHIIDPQKIGFYNDEHNFDRTYTEYIKHVKL